MRSEVRDPRVLVVGSGPIAWLLFASVFKNSSTAHLLQKLGNPSMRRVSGEAMSVRPPPLVFSYDIIFLCVRSYQIEDTLREVGCYFQPGTEVYVCANGYFYQRLEAASRQNPGCIYGLGVCHLGARFDSQGDVIVSGLSNPFFIGTLERATQWVDFFKGMPLFTYLDPVDLQREHVIKWFLNSVINTACVETGAQKNGDLLNHRAHVESLIQEVGAFAQRRFPDFFKDLSTIGAKVWDLIESTASNENSFSRAVRQGFEPEWRDQIGLIRDRFSAYRCTD